MSDETPKQITEGITFRIPTNSISRLREESRKKQVSLNTLVNQIIKEHLDYHTLAAQAGLFYISRSTVSVILDKLTEEQISEIAVPIAIKNEDIGLLLRGEFTLSTFLNIIENWSRVTSFPYKHEINNDVHNFIIQHDMGKKYSFLLKGVFTNILEKFETKIDFTITDNTIVFKFQQG